MSYGLQQRDMDFLLAAFGQFPEIEQVLIFGSHAKGNTRAGSDIDLAVKSAVVMDTTITQLQAMLNALSLPFFSILWTIKPSKTKSLLNTSTASAKLCIKRRLKI